MQALSNPDHPAQRFLGEGSDGYRLEEPDLDRLPSDDSP